MGENATSPVWGRSFQSFERSEMMSAVLNKSLMMVMIEAAVSVTTTVMAVELALTWWVSFCQPQNGQAAWEF